MAQLPNPARPDFAVIGAMRAGTTQLYEMLRRIEGIAVPQMKETDFFCSPESVAKGTEWYARRFADPAALWGDISPNYAKTDINPHAADLLYAANPDARIFFIARDPVARAISHYRMAYFIEPDLPAPEALLSTWSGQHILNASSYHACLLPFWERFGDRVTVLDFTSLAERPSHFMKDICTTLGLPALEVTLSGAPRNSYRAVSQMPAWWSQLRRSDLGLALRANMPRPLLNFVKKQAAQTAPKAAPPPFPDTVRAQIAEALAPDVRQFRQRTGMPFEHWSL